MNLTLSVDAALVERAREVAHQQGTSLNALVREYIQQLAGQRSGAALAQELSQLWKAKSGHSKGKAFRREDAYERRL